MKSIITLNRFNLFALITLSCTFLFSSCSKDDNPEKTNNAPTATNPLQDINLEEGFETYEVNLSNVFSDEDSDQLTIEATSNNTDVVTISISGETLTITEVGVGTSVITLTASDGNGGSVSDSFMVAVNAKLNNAPTVANGLQDVTLDEGFGANQIDFSNVFTDADGDNLNYTVSSTDKSVVTASINGTTLTITEVSSGTSIVKITALDGKGGMVSDEFIVTVNANNTAPTIANAIDNLMLNEGFNEQAIDISNTFSDADGDDLTYAVVSSDESVATVSLSGTVVTITEVNNGTTTISVTADDGNGGTVSDAFDVTINATGGGTTTITFGTNSGNSIEIVSWTAVSSADGYAVVISDVSSISNRTDGEEPLNSTTYVGTGEQVIYVGASSNTLDITLLEDVKTYYFKVFPYTGSYVYDNSQSEQESTTSSCSTSSTLESQVCFSVNGDIRTITSNQYPSHAVGSFPNADPTAIEVTRNFDLTPATAANITYVFDETGPPTPMNQNFWQFGMASNGVEFHPMGLQPWEHPTSGEQNWKWQAQVSEEGQTGLDAYGAHVTSAGNYHYHGDIVALAADEDGSRHSLLYGFAGDGFPIYYKYGYVTANDPTSGIKELLSSHQLKSGSRTGTGTAGEDYPDGTHDGTYIQDYEFVNNLGDLDECNGRTGVTPEFPDGTYYYVITSDFPVTPNCFKGTPDEDWIIGM